MTDLRPPLERVPKTRQEWIALIASLNVRPSKGMGQNFLTDHAIVDRIVESAGTEPGERVVEIGPGLGMLTAHLLDSGAIVDAIELDWQLAYYMRTRFNEIPNLTLHQSDILRTNIQAIVAGASYSVVANLPYSIASAVVMYFLEQPLPPRRMTVMLQREVAERLVALPPSVSVLGVAAQVLAHAEILFTVPSSSFVPAPKVESAVVSLEPIGESLLAAPDRKLFFDLVHGGFRHKRKQVLNSLAFELALPRDVIAARLELAGIDPMRRAQTLSVDEWLALRRVWRDAEDAS